MQFPVFIELRRSRSITLALVFTHAFAASCVSFLSSWSWLPRVVLVALVFLSLLRVLRPARIHGLWLVTRDKLECVLQDGSRASAKIFPESAVFIRLIVVRLMIAEEKRTTSLTLWHDQMSVDEFRSLRVWLRWQRT